MVSCREGTTGSTCCPTLERARHPPTRDLLPVATRPAAVCLMLWSSTVPAVLVVLVVLVVSSGPAGPATPPLRRLPSRRQFLAVVAPVNCMCTVVGKLQWLERM